MPRAIHLRAPHIARRSGAVLLCCWLAAGFPAQARARQGPAAQTSAETPASGDHSAQTPATAPDQSTPNQNAPDLSAPLNPTTLAPTTVIREFATDGPPAGKRQRREAEDAYLAGAKKLEHDDLDAAEREFTRAAALDPGNRNYAIAISVTRQHRLTELVRQVSQARQAGDEDKAQTLLAEARAIDPRSPLVLEHSEPALSSAAKTPQPVSADPGQVSLIDRAQIIADAQPSEPWKIQAPDLTGPVQVTPSAAVKSFDLRGVTSDVVRSVTSAYGIRAVLDDSVEQKNLRFNLENVDYQEAMNALTSIAHVFLVPVDATVLVAKDDEEDRQRLERQLEETIYVPGSTNEQITDLTAVMKNVFDVKQITAQPSAGSIVVRAPEGIMAAMNRTLQGLIDGNGEVVVEVRMYEVDTSKTIDAGTNIPTQFGVYNVDQAAASLVNANQALVQQAITQGLVSPTASNFEIAAALIGSGLVQSSLLTSTIGIVGNGLTQTGITETGSIAINLGLNSSDSRSLDDVQLRVGDRQPATFREGTRYPIATSTYTTGLTGAAASALGGLGNATVNGVSVSSLLAQYAGTTSATIPQISYEDLGVTLEATPTILKSGRVSMALKLKIEALTGSSVNNIPVLASREFDSDLTVAEGQSALMASLVSSSEMAAMTGIPGLSELPGFQLPTSTNAEKDTTQLVLVVTPYIVRQRSDLVAGPRIAVRSDVSD